MIKIKLKMFGVFSDYMENDIVINVKHGFKVGGLRQYILGRIHNLDVKFNVKILVSGSVFSNETAILSDNYVLKDNDIIYFLPPVSGG